MRGELPVSHNLRVQTLFCVLFQIFFFQLDASAYPEFIGYGYRTCLTCHYSGTGGGALTDYGRAVYASEVAAKPFWLSNADDEKLADYSNFLGGVKSPHWFKPGVKYRRLLVRRDPGAAASTNRDILMQTDFNIASFTSDTAKLGVIATLSYVRDERMSAPNRAIGASQMMAREYYLRWQASDHFWWYFGFFDKAYGIKLADHTAFSRDNLHNGMNDQVHGAMLQYSQDKYDLFIHPYLGNLHLAGADQRKGMSALFESEVREKVTYGLTVKHEQSSGETLSSIAGISRIGINGNHALLNELGFKRQLLSGQDALQGAYWYLEAIAQLARGVNFESIFQFERTAFKDDYPENYRWGFGLLLFPIQRMELRTEAIQIRSRSTKQVNEESWQIQSQLHLSL